MSVKYKYSGLTEELYQRLVNEHAALRKAHKKGSYKQFFQDVKQCSELQARIIYQAFNSAVVERARISPATVDRLEGIISDELFNDLQDYLSTNYTIGKTTRPVLEKTNAGLPEHLFKRFREEVEALRILPPCHRSPPPKRAYHHAGRPFRLHRPAPLRCEPFLRRQRSPRWRA